MKLTCIIAIACTLLAGRAIAVMQLNMWPAVINTWAFTNATAKAWEMVYEKNLSSIDAVEHGCTVCEEEQCDGTVGYGGSPDENGETTLDAMIMDGEDMNMGAVGALRRVKSAISVARRVLENTNHSFLVGDQATNFAIQMGFQEESLSTSVSQDIFNKWKENNCQPNFWKNVIPNSFENCGPYTPISLLGSSNTKQETRKGLFNEKNHDTIGMVVIDSNGKMAAGTSTNGARHKIPGRVGDSPIPGAGAYVDSSVGGAAATGDGDIMMRFLPSFVAVEELRRGASPSNAGQEAMRRIIKHHPNFMGGIVVLAKDGTYGAACHGIDTFPFSVVNPSIGEVSVYTVQCMDSISNDV